MINIKEESTSKYLPSVFMSYHSSNGFLLNFLALYIETKKYKVLKISKFREILPVISSFIHSDPKEFSYLKYDIRMKIQKFYLLY